MSWDRLTGLTVHPGDTDDEVLQKRLQTGMAWASIPVIASTGGVVAALHHDPGALALPAVYCALTLALLVHAALTARIEPLRRGHLVVVLAMPAAYQAYLGGFVPSGGFVLWAALAPVAALMFLSRREASFWFGAWLATLALLVLRETLSTGAHEVSRFAVVAQFAANGLGVTTYMFTSTLYFVTQLDAEKRRSDQLLRNVLPDVIARRLRRDDAVIADRFDEVTVLFADIAGFTALSGRLPPEEIVDLLDDVFSAFDDLADRHGVEKIKTIGDAYLVVGGLPEPCADHAVRVARFAKALPAILAGFSAARGLDVSIRIGMHTGPVVAGVIGRRRFAYDLWGDTVNTASRMESHGEGGRVHVTAATRARLDGAFTFEARGEIAVKGKGAMETWWLGEELHRA